MGSPKTLQLFMLDGTADGPIKASIRNWVGRVYSIPRTELNSEELRGRARHAAAPLQFIQALYAYR